jgi:hypothetical protein
MGAGREPWSLGRLEAEADLVVLARFKRSKESDKKIDFAGDSFKQKTTQFEVLSVLKNKEPKFGDSAVNVIHFWTPPDTPTGGSFRFFSFDEFSSDTHQKVLSKDNVYLLYLRRSDFESFVPVTGHSNALASIMLVSPL